MEIIIFFELWILKRYEEKEIKLGKKFHIYV
jgi:hypothetical protein